MAFSRLLGHQTALKIASPVHLMGKSLQLQLLVEIRMQEILGMIFPLPRNNFGC